MKRVLLALVLLVICAPILAADTRYEVKDHDTLAGILRQLGYGETYAELLPFIEQIVEMNRDVLRNDNADFLFPGSVLTLPKNPNEPEPEPEPVAEPEPIPEPEPEPEPAIASIGSVQISSGTAEIKRENETIAVAQKEELFESDIIITRDESVAEITLADNTRISVGPNSEFSINEYSYAVPADSSGDVLGSLVASIRRGVIRTITGLIGKLQSNRFEIKSALSATIGIRGTDFTVRTCTQASTCGDLYGVSVGVRDGNISFKNDSAEIELAPNEFAQVQSATETPVKVPLPEGFFDLKRDITEIAVDKSWWERSIDYLKALTD